MKIKYLFALILSLALLPAGVYALDENYCDNAVYNDYYARFNGKSITNDLQYAMGTRQNRAIYKNEMLRFCAETTGARACNKAFFGSDREFGDRVMVNMPAFLILINNRVLFEALVTEGGYGYLIDNGIYDIEHDHGNGDYLTPALLAVREGQIGTLRYLVNKYHVNLFKLSGYVYRSPRKPKDTPRNAKRLVEVSLQRFQEKGDYAKVECMLAVQRFVDRWFEENANNQEYLQDAERYNAIINEWAPRNMIQNDIPFEFIPSLDLFRLQGVEENVAQTIEKQIDTLIEKIMRDFDLSAFGNQA